MTIRSVFQYPVTYVTICLFFYRTKTSNLLQLNYKILLEIWICQAPIVLYILCYRISPAYACRRYTKVMATKHFIQHYMFSDPNGGQLTQVVTNLEWQEGVGWVVGAAGDGLKLPTGPFGGSMCPRSASYGPRQAWMA